MVKKKLKKISPDEVYRMLCSEPGKLHCRMPQGILDEADKRLKERGWKNRTQLIEHLICTWIIDEKFAEKIAEARDKRVNWEDENL